MVESRPQQARYLFAVGRNLDVSVLSTTAGLRGMPLEVVGYRDLQAVVCTVDLDDFGEEALTRNLEDMAWLEEVALRHHDVVYAISSSGTVAPMRLVTVCSDDDSVRARIEAVHDELSQALTRVEGSSEWSVKVYAPPREAQVEEAVHATPSGAAYLQRKRAQAAHRRSADELSQQLAQEIHQTLADYVAAVRVLSPQDPRLTGRTDTMILNGAYLVPEADGDGFRSVVQRQAELHSSLVIELKGPWPPYSFATLD